MNSNNINRNVWALTLPILFSMLANLRARNRQLTMGGSQILKRSTKYSLFFVAVMLFASTEASAVNSITCNGGRLYLEQSQPDGDICWETGMTCNGEWSYSWNLVKKGGDNWNVFPSSQSRMRVRTAGATTPQGIVGMMRSLKEWDLRLFYQAPSSIAASFRQRKGWPETAKSTIDISEGTLPIWLEALARKKSSDATTALNDATTALNKAQGYPPHGYPCLGCHPCPPDYCDDDNKKLKESDLAPVFFEQGYRVKDGKIGKVAVTYAFPGSSINSTLRITPNVKRLDSRNANAAKRCTDEGGIVATDANGQTVCAKGYRAAPPSYGCSVPPCYRPKGGSGCVCP